MRNARLLLVLSFVPAGLASLQAQNKAIAPTENLVVDGIPAIPGVARRRGAALHRVAPGELRRLAPDAAARC